MKFTFAILFSRVLSPQLLVTYHTNSSFPEEGEQQLNPDIITSMGSKTAPKLS